MVVDAEKAVRTFTRTVPGWRCFYGPKTRKWWAYHHAATRPQPYSKPIPPKTWRLSSTVSARARDPDDPPMTPGALRPTPPCPATSAAVPGPGPAAWERPTRLDGSSSALHTERPVHH